ncbi:hypothetical protein MKK82_11055 [Methylobacterium sp. E-046]|nr:hypothetical protein [Methylobacterium sp. E-046]
MRTALAALALVVAVGGARAADQCEGVIKLQGFFSRAQFQCGLTSNHHRTVPRVEECAARINERKMEQILTAGMKMYDAQEAKRGRAATCTELSNSFPDIMGR